MSTHPSAKQPEAAHDRRDRRAPIDALPVPELVQTLSAGKATGEQHRSQGPQPADIPLVSLDFFYITEKGDVARQGELEGYGVEKSEAHFGGEKEWQIS